MPTTYELRPGTYVIGDPAVIVRKNDRGTAWTEKLWETFYLDMNRFHRLTIDGVTFMITRTAEGDGYFDGVGTDTGTIMILRTEDVMGDDRFQPSFPKHGCRYLSVTENDHVTVMDFNIFFESGLSIRTQG